MSAPAGLSRSGGVEGDGEGAAPVEGEAEAARAGGGGGAGPAQRPGGDRGDRSAGGARGRGAPVEREHRVVVERGAQPAAGALEQRLLGAPGGGDRARI